MRCGGLIGAVAILGLATAGCSMSFPLPSLVSDPETTGSIVPAATPPSTGLGPGDWNRASVALDRALDPRQNGAETAWTNEETGASGRFRADGPAFVKNDEVCRNFRSSIVRDGAARTLLGTACRSGAGAWALRETHVVSAEDEAQGPAPGVAKPQHSSHI